MVAVAASALLALPLAFAWALQPQAQSWTAPIGIPNPPPGLAPERSTPSSASQCPNWPSAASTNCYYIDNSVSCSDAGNGFPTNPRCTLPANNTDFLRIEIKGGGAAYAWSNRQWNSTGGTEASPAVVTGLGGSCINPTLAETFPTTNEASWTNCPVIGTGNADFEFNLVINWAIVQGLNLNRVRFRGSNPYSFNNALFRWNHSYAGRQGNGAAYGVGFDNAGSSVYNNNVLIYKTEVSDWCDMTSVGEEDCLGVVAGSGSSNIWVVDNLHYDINGDSIRTGTNPLTGKHTYGSPCSQHRPNRAFNIFVGRNTYKLNGENAIDVKDSDGTVFSQNNIVGPFNLGGSASGGGGAISSHNHAKNTWIIFNHIEGGSIGMAITTDIAGTEDGYYIGNVIHNIEHVRGSYDPNSVTVNDGAGFHIRTAHGDCVLQHNTFYATDRGFNIETAQTGCVLLDNIVSTLNEAQSHFGFEDSRAFNGSTLSHNLVHRVLGRFGQVGSSNYTTLANFNAAAGPDCTRCVEGKPLFTNAGSGDFTLSSASSAAKDVASGITTWYDLFESTWRVNINVDAAGAARPRNGQWDIGAYEFQVKSVPVARGHPVRVHGALDLPLPVWATMTDFLGIRVGR